MSLNEESMNKLQILLIRWLFGKGDKERLKNDTVPTGLDVVKDVFYLNDGKKEHSFDVIYPAQTGKKLPAIFNIHGGAFVCGDKKIYDNYCRRLALYGYTVVNINYGLAPKYVFPSHISDCIAAINFACENAYKFYIDTDNYYIVGDSAGGMIGATIGLIATNPAFAMNFKANLRFKPKALGLSCGQFDFDGEISTHKKFKPLDTYFGKKEKDYPPRNTYDIFDSITRDFPPSFLTSCADDELRSDSIKFQHHLDEAGVKNKWLFYDETHNPLGHVYSCRWIHNDGRPMPEAVEARDIMLDFFREQR